MVTYFIWRCRRAAILAALLFDFYKKILYNKRKNKKGENSMFDDFDLEISCEEYYENEYYFYEKYSEDEKEF